MSDNGFWSVFVVCCAIVLLGICLAGKSCNDADDQLISVGLQHGCASTVDKRGAREFTCPQPCPVQQVK